MPLLPTSRWREEREPSGQQMAPGGSAGQRDTVCELNVGRKHVIISSEAGKAFETIKQLSQLKNTQLQIAEKFLNRVKGIYKATVLPGVAQTNVGRG